MQEGTLEAAQTQQNALFPYDMRPQAGSFFGFQRPDIQSRGNSFMRDARPIFMPPGEQATGDNI